MTELVPVALPSVYQEFIALSRYARYDSDLKRRELWHETVQRLVNFWRNRFPDLDEAMFMRLHEAILNLRVMPSMRSLMTAGEAATRDEISLYNCSTAAVTGTGPSVSLWDSKLEELGFDEPITIQLRTPIVFDELLYILLCGTGAGFSVERQFVSEMPTVGNALARSIYRKTKANFPGVPKDELSAFDRKRNTIHVADSKYGWASALRILVVELYNGNYDVKYNTDDVRGAGEILKVFGGRASGPAALVQMFEDVREVFRAADGRKLTSIECHDVMCYVAQAVVVGGVRRAALISLSNLSDDRMRYAKSGEWWNTDGQRALSNNSVAYTEKPTMGSFMREWQALYDSKSGERGIFNREAAKRYAEASGRDANHEFLTNPCCFTGDSTLLTNRGYVRFDTLAEGGSTQVKTLDGGFSNGHVWVTGEKEVVSIGFRNNRAPIKSTPEHVFMLNDGSSCEAKDLAGKRLMPEVAIKESFAKDELLAGFMLGDAALSRLNSSAHRGLEVYFGEKDGDIAELCGTQGGSTWYSREAYDIAKRFSLPAATIGSRGFGSDFRLLSGLFSANGSVIAGARVALKSIDRRQLEEAAEIMRDFCGIESYITTNKKHDVEFENGVYECKESYDLNISQYESIRHFASSISFGQKYKQEALRDLLIARSPCVRSVVKLGVEQVYDFSEPTHNWGYVDGVVAHNCEIILRPQQLCNLSSIVVRADDTFEDLKDKAEIATILGTLQATATNFVYLSPRWKHNCEEERLLGVSMTGPKDHPVLQNVSDDAKTWLQDLSAAVRETNAKYAKMFGINPAAALTCNKPEGTSSQLNDTASGLHKRFAPYYIRRVRADEKDPLATVMEAQGFPCESDVMQPSNKVFSFPVKAPEASATADIPALDQLEYWLMWKQYWCDSHNPSVTIYVKEDEWFAVGAWVYKNFDDICGISFLPHSDHTYQQAPYEACTAEEYEAMIALMPTHIDHKALAALETTDHTTGMQEYACSGNSCELT